VDHPALEESLDLASLRSIAQYRCLLAENIARRAGVSCTGVPPRTRAGFKWNTRQESNLRALGSKPNGDAGNPRLVYWLRRQESDLRGLRSERSWDASNPHLNKMAGQ
jgi:hypothetical protein